jgi:hypothetical protein
MSIQLQLPLPQFANLTKQMADELPRMEARAMWKALALAGQIATGQYMIMTGGASGSTLPGVGTAVNATRLTWRSGRLARSLVGQSTWVQDTSGVRREAEGDRVVEVRPGSFYGRITTYVPYARRHEYGGTFPVTNKQAVFFYHKWQETRNEMWKAMSYSRTITTPPRPFMGPTFQGAEFRQGIQRIFAAEFDQLFRDSEAKSK